VNDLVDFFKRASRKRKRGPAKTALTVKGPAVTTGTYFIKRTIPLVIIAGTPWGTNGPAVNECGKPANTNIKNNNPE
jgi:hypothetical protein